VLAAAGAAAGAINAIAGGGTLVSFPTLLWLGRDPVVASATNTVALWPGSLAAVLAFRGELSVVRPWVKALAGPSIAGGAVGGVLLLLTPSKAFAALVPWLILFATALLAAQGPLSRRAGIRLDPGHQEPPPAPGRRAGPAIFLFLVGIYGGYFGAGIGIMTLAGLAFLGFADMLQMIALRNFCALAINGTAALYFVIRGAVVWPDALLMIAGQLAGSYAGVRIARRLGQRWLRPVVVAIGLALTASFLFGR
jgi:hypothetical protein